MRHLLDVDDLTPSQLTGILDAAEASVPLKLLSGQGVALLFEKPSTRTRVSMEMAVVALGGHPISLRAEEVGLGVREPAADVARVLGGYCALIGARVFAHSSLAEMAATDSAPVLNLLSDDAHPCQALADLLTLRQHFGHLQDLCLAWVGDGNNVCRSLMAAAEMSGMEMRVAAPSGYEPPEREGVVITDDPVQAVAGAAAVVTDVWASMGQEDDAARRRRDFAGFMVDEALMAHAQPEAVFLHCLPAHRGDEVAASVVDGPRSLVWREAANRLPAQRAVLAWLLGTEVDVMDEDGS